MTVEDETYSSAEAEDVALAQAIDEGLKTEPVSEQCVLDMLRKPDGA